MRDLVLVERASEAATAQARARHPVLSRLGDLIDRARSSFG